MVEEAKHKLLGIEDHQRPRRKTIEITKPGLELEALCSYKLIVRERKMKDWDNGR
jgi:hypothetical protein